MVQSIWEDGTVQTCSWFLPVLSQIAFNYIRKNLYFISTDMNLQSIQQQLQCEISQEAHAEERSQPLLPTSNSYYWSNIPK